MCFLECLRKYEDYCLSVLQYTPKTVVHRKRYLRHLYDHGVDLLVLDPDDVYEYFAGRIRRGAKGFQLNHYVRALNSWCSFRGVDHHFDMYKKFEKPMRIPTSEDMRVLLRSCGRSRVDKRTKTIMFLLAHTGMRVSELTHLVFDDIDYVHNQIHVVGKGNRERYIPVKGYVLDGVKHPSVKNYIDHHRKDSCKKYVFTSDTGRLTSNTVRKDIKELGRSVGLSWVHPHSFRHYYATELLRKGVNVKVLQLILGHGDISQTSIYLHFVEKDLHFAVDQIRFDDLLFSRDDFSLTRVIGGDFYGSAGIC
jgi:integrase/recombinase XerD